VTFKQKHNAQEMVLQSAEALRTNDHIAMLWKPLVLNRAPLSLSSLRWIRAIPSGEDVPCLSFSCPAASQSSTKDIASALSYHQNLMLYACSQLTRPLPRYQPKALSLTCDPDQPHQLSLLGSVLG
jgi:hypothetical protein